MRDYRAIPGRPHDGAALPTHRWRPCPFKLDHESPSRSGQHPVTRGSGQWLISINTLRIATANSANHLLRPGCPRIGLNDLVATERFGALPIDDLPFCSPLRAFMDSMQ